MLIGSNTVPDVIILRSEGRERQRELREAAVLRAQERAKEEQEEKASKKQELNRFGVQQQMDVSGQLYHTLTD